MKNLSNNKYVFILFFLAFAACDDKNESKNTTETPIKKDTANNTIDETVAPPPAAAVPLARTPPIKELEVAMDMKNKDTEIIKLNTEIIMLKLENRKLTQSNEYLNNRIKDYKNAEPDSVYLRIEKEFIIATQTEQKDNNGAAAIAIINKHKKELIQSPERITNLLEQHAYYMYKHPNVQAHLIAWDPKSTETQNTHVYIVQAAPQRVWVEPKTYSSKSSYLKKALNGKKPIEEVIYELSYFANNSRLSNPDFIQIALDQHKDYINQHSIIQNHLEEIGFSQKGEKKTLDDYAAYAKKHPKLLVPLKELVGPDSNDIACITLKNYIKALTSYPSSQSEHVTNQLKSNRVMDFRRECGPEKTKANLQTYESFIKQQLNIKDIWNRNWTTGLLFNE